MQAWDIKRDIFWMQVVGIQVLYASIYFKKLFILIINIKLIFFIIILN